MREGIGMLELIGAPSETSGAFSRLTNLTSLFLFFIRLWAIAQSLF